MHRAAVERDRFDAAMGGEQDGAAGRLVDAARLHADEAVLDQVEPADAVVVAELVEPARAGWRATAPRRRSRPDRRARSRSRSIVALSGASSGEMVRWWTYSGASTRRVLEHFPFRGGVEQIGVDREGRFASLVLADRDLVLLGEVDQLLAAGELPFAPRGDHAGCRARAHNSRARSGPGRCPCRWRRGRPRRRRPAARSRSGAWRSAAARSRCRADTGPRRAVLARNIGKT